MVSSLLYLCVVVVANNAKQEEFGKIPEDLYDILSYYIYKKGDTDKLIAKYNSWKDPLVIKREELDNKFKYDCIKTFGHMSIITMYVSPLPKYNCNLY